LANSTVREEPLDEPHGEGHAGAADDRAVLDEAWAAGSGISVTRLVVG
jgi:hypothetical protein